MKRSRSTRTLGLAAGLALAVALPAGAQQNGGVRGTVTTSEDRGAILGARVVIRSPERVAISDERGTYQLRDVPVGQYMVYVTAIGRKPDSTRVTVSAN